MKILRKLSRRSFLTQVTGAGIGGGALSFLTGDALAFVQSCTDTDSGTSADPGGQGRRCAGRQHSGITDSDSGAAADPSGFGRGRLPPQFGGPQPTNVTDSDPTDPVGRGRGSGVRTGVTDRDSGASADPAGNGRGQQQPVAGQPSEQERWESCVRLSNRRDELRRELLQPQYWDRDTIAGAIEDADRIDSILYIDPDEGPMLDPGKYGDRQMNAYEIAARYGVGCHPTDDRCFAPSLRRMASTAGSSHGSAQHVQMQGELARIEEAIGRNCPNTR